MLEVREVFGGYGAADILKGASLRVDAGDLTVIIGPNGAGKSTLMKAIFGLVRLRKGEVLFKGADIANAAPESLVPKGLAYVPQERNVFPSLTIEENLRLGAFTAPGKAAEGYEKVFAVFPDLRDRRAQKAGTLSGGQRQMVAIGRALMLKPELLMLDEPTAGLSPLYIESMFERIREINRAGTTVLMVEQNARLALRFASVGYVLANGANRFRDSGPALLANPEIAEMFLGG
jgi:branched-chain amino acid transport system ATP-binding protein